MSRLYYDTPPKTTILENAIEDEGGALRIVAKDDKQASFDDYLNKVSRLIPSEVLAGYLTMFGLVGAIKNAAAQTVFYWLVFLTGLILTPLYLNKVADADKPKRNHLIISTIAFIVWAYVTTGKTLTETFSTNGYDAAIASIILIVFSFVSALIPLDK